MLSKEEIIKTIEELKINIKETENEIDELESEIDSLEYDLDYNKGHLEEMEYQLDYYEKELLKLQNPQEQLPYWLEYIHDNCRISLNGQFERNGKWYVCNGYVLLESNTKFDCLKVCKGIDNLPQYFDGEKEEISFDIDNYDNGSLGVDIVCDDWIVSGTYLIACKNILQLNDNSKFYTTYCHSDKNYKSFICENENGRALILGKRPSNFD